MWHLLPIACGICAIRRPMHGGFEWCHRGIPGGPGAPLGHLASSPCSAHRLLSSKGTGPRPFLVALFTQPRRRRIRARSGAGILGSPYPCLLLGGATPQGASILWHSVSPSFSDARAPPAARACDRGALASPRGPP